MPIYPSIDAQGVRETIAELRKLDPGLVSALRKDMRSSLKPFAQEIKEALPMTAPLSGMDHNGDTRYLPSTVTVSLTTGRSKKHPTLSALASIRVTPRNKSRGLYLAELAGTRSNGYTPQGRNLIAVLNERRQMRVPAGRFIYDTFRRNKNQIFVIAISVLNKHLDQVNVRLSH
jgi:hypothetical protein